MDDLVKASTTKIFRGKPTNQDIPLPDWSALEVEMQRIKETWLQRIGQDTSVSSFDAAEDLIGINIRAWEVDVQTPIPRTRRGIKTSQVRESCMRYEKTANIALYQGHRGVLRFWSNGFIGNFLSPTLKLALG